MYIRYYWQRNHQVYGHIRHTHIYIYMVLASPTNIELQLLRIVVNKNITLATCVDLTGMPTAQE